MSKKCLNFGDIDTETILIGNQPVSIPSGNFLIKDQTEFNNIWKKILGEDSSPPTMDFSSKIAVAVISEQKSTSGFSLVVDKVFLKDNFVEVNISEISPGQNCFLTQSIAQSFHVFSLPKFEKEYKLNIISKIQNCF